MPLFSRWDSPNGNSTTFPNVSGCLDTSSPNSSKLLSTCLGDPKGSGETTCPNFQVYPLETKQWIFVKIVMQATYPSLRIFLFFFLLFYFSLKSPKSWSPMTPALEVTMIKKDDYNGSLPSCVWLKIDQGRDRESIQWTTEGQNPKYFSSLTTVSWGRGEDRRGSWALANTSNLIEAVFFQVTPAQVSLYETGLLSLSVTSVPELVQNWPVSSFYCCPSPLLASSNHHKGNMTAKH